MQMEERWGKKIEKEKNERKKVHEEEEEEQGTLHSQFQNSPFVH